MGRVTHADFVQSIYDDTYKELKLAPAHVGQIKKVLLKASKASKQNKRSVRKAGDAWLKEKGLGIYKNKKKSKKKTSTKVDTPPKLKTDKEGKIKIDVRKLDRKQLRGMAKDLGVKTKKSMTESDLRTIVADKMAGMADETPEVLATIDDTKVDDCIGLFIDLTNATCISCPLQKDCRELFSDHQESGFEAFKKIKNDIATEEEADEVEADDLPPKKKSKKKDKKKSKKKKDKKFIAKRKINVYEVEFDDDDDSAEFLKALQKQVPETMGELRDLVLEHYEPEGDSDEAANDLVLDVADQLVELEAIELLK